MNKAHKFLKFYYLRWMQKKKKIEELINTKKSNKIVNII
jgi:hypothetical protein